MFTVIQLSEVVMYDILSKRGVFTQTRRRKTETEPQGLCERKPLTMEKIQTVYKTSVCCVEEKG